MRPCSLLPVLKALPSLPTWNHGFLLVALLAWHLSVSDKWPLLWEEEALGQTYQANLSQQPPKKAGKGTQGAGAELSHLHTSLKGSFPVSFRPSMTILATQKKRISWPVSSRVPG